MKDASILAIGTSCPEMSRGDLSPCRPYQGDQREEVDEVLRRVSLMTISLKGGEFDGLW